MKKSSHLRKITFSAMLAALSVVIGIICKNLFTFGVYYRITFENLPIIFAGILFGPVYGAAVGICGDIVSCLCSVNPAVNPIITVGAAVVGLTSGIVSHYVIKRKALMRIAVSAYTAHLTGQVIIKSVAKMLYFGMPAIGMLFCFLISFGVATIEIYIIYFIFKSKPVSEALERLK